jgi:hypothetical protein
MYAVKKAVTSTILFLLVVLMALSGAAYASEKKQYVIGSVETNQGTQEIYLVYTESDAGIVITSISHAAYGAAKFGITAGALELTIPESIDGKPVVEIGSYAFRDCYWATNTVTIPSSVTTIGEEAFYNTAISGVILQEGLKSIGFAAFGGSTNISTISIPASVTTIESAALQSPSLTSISVAAGNTSFTAIDGVLFDASGTTLLCYPPSKCGDTYTIPADVTISSNAFYGCNYLQHITFAEGTTVIGGLWGCSSLTAVTIPSSAKTIDKNAFYNTGLTSIEIPEGVEVILDGAFSYCTSLKEITFPSTLTQLGCTNGGYGVLESCTRLTTVSIPGSVQSIGDKAFSWCTSLTDVVIQEGVVTLGSGIFDGCSALERISLPASITRNHYSISSSNCPKVTTIYYGGSEEQWDTLRFYLHSDMGMTEASPTIRYNTGPAVISSVVCTGKYASTTAVIEETDSEVFVTLDTTTNDTPQGYLVEYSDAGQMTGIKILSGTRSGDTICFSGTIGSDLFKMFILDSDCEPITQAYETMKQN